MNLECKVGENANTPEPGETWTALPAPEQCTGLEFLYSDGTIEWTVTRKVRDWSALPTYLNPEVYYTERATAWRYFDGE